MSLLGVYFVLGATYHKQKGPGFKTDMYYKVQYTRRVLVGRKSEGRKLNDLRNDVGREG